MKIKKMLSALLAGIMMFSAILLPQETILSQQSSSTAAILEELNLSAEPMTAAAADGTMRRPVSNEQPMWIVHIDSWNYPDPEKIIKLIPEDILPYVVFNISMSVNRNTSTGKFTVVEYAYETAKSWLRTCADLGVWAMIQPSSGGPSRFPDYDSSTNYEETIYAEFYRDYPNFIGFSYCEQYWGFDQEGYTVSAEERYQHLAQLLKLSDKYGGYVIISWCGNRFSTNINPIAMLKNVPEWEEACRNYSDHYILCEKFTTVSYIHDRESLILGSYLSGYCGNWGIRYDETGWSSDGWTEGETDEKTEYTLATGLAPHLEKMLMSGMTVIDGPELVWREDFTEVSKTTDTDGYTTRNWEMYDQFQNVMIDMFRKIIDGSVRIPSRQEVVDDTKVVIINDVSSGTDDEKYSSPETLFEGLYRMDSDGNYRYNNTHYKKTGRYPVIPVVYGLNDSVAKSFDVQINQSQYSSRWSSISAKTTELNTLFPNEYSGDVYAGRRDNTWVIYNPYKTAGKNASGKLPFKYNTADSAEVTLTRYSAGVMTEYSDYVEFYLNNYDNKVDTSLKTNIIKINGCSSEPEFTWADRGYNQTASKVTSSYANGTLTITIQHNGPVELTVSCSGNAEGRSTSYASPALQAPDAPPVYLGERQYEGETFDYKNIEGCTTNGYNTGITDYEGQGYIKLGKNASAAVKDTVHMQNAGEYELNIRYTADADTDDFDLYVNGEKSQALTFKKTSSMSTWTNCTVSIVLTEGDNTIEIKASSAASGNVYIDNFKLTGNYAATDENGYYFHDDFEELGYDWTPRNTATIGLSSRIPYMGYNSLVVHERETNWSGTQKALNTDVFKPGGTYAFGVVVGYIEGTDTEDFYLTLQYTDSNNGTVYQNIDTKTAVKGSYVLLSNSAFTIPEDARNPIIAIETATQAMNFYIDEAIGAPAGTKISGPEEISLRGDVNADGTFNVADVVMLQKWLICTPNSTLTDWQAADMCDDDRIDVFDLCIMKRELLKKS